MAATAIAAAQLTSDGSEKTPPDPHPATVKFCSKTYCLAHSSYMVAKKSQVCAFCGVKKKRHTAPLLIPDTTVLDFVEVSAVENPSSCAMMLFSLCNTYKPDI